MESIGVLVVVEERGAGWLFIFFFFLIREVRWSNEFRFGFIDLWLFRNGNDLYR
jgi:hypothetical protein